DMGNCLVERLRGALVPDLIQNASEIGLRSPEDRGDTALGLFLYDIRPSEEVYQKRAVVSNDRISKPPVFLSLSYMITAYSQGDIQYRLSHEERVLGRVIQYFHDNPIIPLEEVDPQMTSGTELHIHMLKLDPDEKSRIWSFPNVGNRLSLFYKVSPVAIDSEIKRDVTRVTDLDINVSLNLRNR
ncbi:MAG: DUF4255 domain-containing protein, partial [Lachnospiraceae bacterium]|nr:DUF4255 domain-containing protein [Lachnospiraceae bacterium]